MAKDDKTEVQPAVLPKSKPQIEAEYARVRQDMLRGEAPKGVSVGKTWTNPLDGIVKLYCPECVGKDRTHDAFTGDADLHQQYLDQGYEPVVSGGQHVKNGRDLLYRRPKDFLDRQMTQAQQMSHARMAADVSDDDEKTLVAPKVEVTRGT